MKTSALRKAAKRRANGNEKPKVSKYGKRHDRVRKKGHDLQKRAMNFDGDENISDAKANRLIKRGGRKIDKAKSIRDKANKKGNVITKDRTLKDGGRLLNKSKRLQEKDIKLKAKATKAYKEGKDTKADRIQDRRMRVQKREHKAFVKGYRKKLKAKDNKKD